jgi:hypothetical protein
LKRSWMPVKSLENALKLPSCWEKPIKSVDRPNFTDCLFLQLMPVFCNNVRIWVLISW